MAQVLVRDLEPEVVAELKAKAARNGRSLEAELRHILRQASGLDRRAALEQLKRIHEKQGDRIFSDSTELIREDRCR